MVPLSMEVSIEKKTCLHCHCTFQPIRNPRQQFCSGDPCQNARKSKWRRAKCRDDPDYRENQKNSYKIWVKKNSAYWNLYRASRPDYVTRNREQQQGRNLRNRSLCKRDVIAKSDALIPEISLETGIYQLVPVTNLMIAKSDALLVKISPVTNSYP